MCDCGQAVNQIRRNPTDIGAGFVKEMGAAKEFGTRPFVLSDASLVRWPVMSGISLYSMAPTSVWRFSPVGH